LIIVIDGRPGLGLGQLHCQLATGNWQRLRTEGPRYRKPLN